MRAVVQSEITTAWPSCYTTAQPSSWIACGPDNFLASWLEFSFISGQWAQKSYPNARPSRIECSNNGDSNNNWAKLFRFKSQLPNDKIFISYTVIVCVVVKKTGILTVFKLREMNGIS